MVWVWFWYGFQLRANENLGKSMDLAAFARKTIENHWFFNGFATKTTQEI